MSLLLLSASLLIWIVVKKWFATLWFVVWPGTVVHEIMHYLVGKLLFADPQAIKILPTHDEQGEIYGSVTFGNLAWYNAAPVALAPLLGLPLALYMFGHTHYFVNTWLVIPFVWILVAIISQSMPSSTDWHVAKSYPGGIVAWALGIGYFVV